MARRRMIDPSMWDDEDVGALSDGAFRLWVACISNADDEGKLLASPARLRALAFRYRYDVSVEQVALWLEEIDCAIRSVIIYSVEGRGYIKLLNWATYQTINRPVKSKIPDPQDNDNSCMPHACLTDTSCMAPPQKKRSTREVQGTVSKDTGHISTANGAGKKAATDLPDVQEVFETYRTLTGNTDAKLTDKGRAAIRARLKSGYTTDDLTGAIRALMANEWWRTNHSKQPVSWFFRSDDQVEKLRGIRPDKVKSNGNKPTVNSYVAGMPRAEEGAFDAYGD